MSHDEVENNFEVSGSLHEAKLREISMLIRAALPPSMGFTLLIYDYAVERKGVVDTDNLFYSSSANRGETIEMMEEFIKKLKV